MGTWERVRRPIALVYVSSRLLLILSIMAKSLKQQCVERKRERSAYHGQGLRERIATKRVVSEMDWAEGYARDQLLRDQLFSDTEGRKGRALNRDVYLATLKYAEQKLKRLSVGLPREQPKDDAQLDLAATLRALAERLPS